MIAIVASRDTCSLPSFSDQVITALFLFIYISYKFTFGMAQNDDDKFKWEDGSSIIVIK